MNEPPSTVFEIYEFVSAGGLPALLLLIVYSGYKRVWVWGRELDEANDRADRAERRSERYERLAERTTPALIRFTAIAERLFGKESHYDPG